MNDDESRWYLCHCKPREDERALEHLMRQGFHCYRPMLSVERLNGGQRSLAPRALFPGYLFIRLDRIHDNWMLIRSTRGVLQLVRFGEYPVPVRDEVVEQIRHRLEHQGAEPYLRPGERVRITEGPFSELEAIFVSNDGNERVVLLLSMLQTEQQLSFPLQSVRRIG